MTTTCKATIEHWLDASGICVEEFASTSLGCEDSEILGNVKTIPQGMAGAYLAMVGTDESIQIGFVSSKEGCKSLSGALLCMEPEELDELTDADIADAMGEVINIIAGMVKTEMSKLNANFNLGLPIFLDGKIETSPQQESGAVKIRIGEIETQMIIVKQQETS